MGQEDVYNFFVNNKDCKIRAVDLAIKLKLSYHSTQISILKLYKQKLLLKDRIGQKVYYYIKE